MKRYNIAVNSDGWCEGWLHRHHFFFLKKIDIEMPAEYAGEPKSMTDYSIGQSAVSDQRYKSEREWMVNCNGGLRDVVQFLCSSYSPRRHSRRLLYFTVFVWDKVDKIKKERYSK